MKTTYYDFSSSFKTFWWLQSKLFKNVLFYRDQTQHCYCRQINNVEGRIEEDIDGTKWFVPNSWLVSYRQSINSNNEYRTKKIQKGDEEESNAPTLSQ